LLASPVTILAAGPYVFELSAGVVVDREKARVFIMHPEHQVEALELGTGTTLWQSEAAEKPLWVEGDALIAQASAAHDRMLQHSGDADQPDSSSARGTGNDLLLVSIDASDGETLPMDHRVPLPEGVNPIIGGIKSESFKVKLRPASGSLALFWDYRDTREISKPWPDARPPRVVHESGAAQLQADQPGVLAVDSVAAASLLEPPAALAPMLASGELLPPYWQVDGLVASVANNPLANGSRQLVLNRWNAADGTALPALPLMEGDVVASRAAADGQMILVVTTTGKAITGVPVYLWTFYSLATGERVAELEMNRSALPFNLVEQGLLVVTPPFSRWREVQGTPGDWVVEPPAVRLLELRSGKEIWSATIRDTVYRGPVAPARGSDN
jgi:hypothetical protein